jgi:CheY-like chemotaxis protein
VVVCHGHGNGVVARSRDQGRRRLALPTRPQAYYHDHGGFKPWRLFALAFKSLRRLRPDYPIWRDLAYEYEKDRPAIDGSDLLRRWVDDPAATPELDTLGTQIKMRPSTVNIRCEHSQFPSEAESAQNAGPFNLSWRKDAVIPTPQREGAIKVLHIEDDPSVARSMARLLRAHGYEVVSAASGDEAIQLVEDGLLPDLILTDYHLPLEMTGEQVVTEVATRLGFKPPTIMLASVPGPEVEKMMSVADRIFAKPADIDVLLREIKSRLWATGSSRSR